MNKNKIPKRLTALLLSAVLLCSTIFSVFAWNMEPGQKCGSKIGVQYLSSDGRNYMDVGTDHYVIHYHPDGSTTVDLEEGRYKVRRHLLLVNPNTKEEKWVYCIEEGVSFDASNNGYTSYNANNSKYFAQLPRAVRDGIMMVAMYGYQEGKTIPITGLNADDAFFAGQVLIWEFQQSIRTDAGARKDNGKIKADTYYNLLKGRPAEKMYDYLLEKIRQHSIVPSFTSKDRLHPADEIVLEYNSSTGKYSKTIEDKNKTGIDIAGLSAVGVSITRSGNSYTITSDKPIDTAVILPYRKNIPIVGGRFLVWGRPGYQTLCTGADDPITFYLNVRTESFGSMKLVKTSEDGKVSGVSFRITGSGVDKTVTTNSAGEIQVSELRAGVYTVTERTGAQYVPQNSQQVTIVPGRTSTVTFNNVLKRGSLTVTKTSEDGLKQGVRFRLSGRSDCGLTVDEYAVTDNSGKAYFRDVLIGTGYML